MEYVLHLCVILCIYTLPATSLDLLVGHLGIMSLSHAAFFGVGAYATAIASTTIGVPFPLTTIISIIVGGLLALPVAAVASRLRGDYLLVATFGLQIVMFNVFNNWTAVTGGSLGISKVAPFFSSYERCGVLLALATSVVLLALGLGGCWTLSAGSFGRLLHATREDEDLAQAWGKNTGRTKKLTFVVSSALAGAAGSEYAHYVSHVSPLAFTVMESVMILSMVVLGGAASRFGPLLGAFVVVLLPECLRFFGLSGAIVAQGRQIVFGLTLVLTMWMNPTGLLGKYGFDYSNDDGDT